MYISLVYVYIHIFVYVFSFLHRQVWKGTASSLGSGFRDQGFEIRVCVFGVKPRVFGGFVVVNYQHFSEVSDSPRNKSGYSSVYSTCFLAF